MDKVIFMQTFRERLTTLKEKSILMKGYLPKDRRTDLFGKEYLSPHEEMRKCKEAYNNNGLISSAVDSLTDFIMGNNLFCESKDESTSNFFQTKIDDSDPDMFETAREHVENAVKTGNGYVEIDWDNNNLPVAYYPVADSTRIYLNTDAYGMPVTKTVFDPVTEQSRLVYNLDEYYIQEVPQNWRAPSDAPSKPKWYTLTYSFSSYKEVKIFGIPIHKDKLMHIKWGTGDTGLYGRSFIASVLDDHEILKRIEKAMGIIAKYKAIPRKMFSPADNEEFSQDDVDELATYFEGLEDDENAISWKKMRVDDLSYAGREINMDGAVDHTRRKIISGLTPEFLIGYGMDTNMATANQLLIAYMLRLETKRNIWEKQWNKYFIRPYQRKYTWLKKASIKFGDIDFRTPEERNNEIRARWQANQITFNQMQEELGYPTNKNGEVYYKDFITQGLSENTPVPSEVQDITPNPVKVNATEKIAKRVAQLMRENHG